jgi:hypothetical protein
MPYTEVGGYGGMFEFDTNKAQLKGSGNKQWTVNVNALNGKKKGGTYTKFGGLIGNGVSIVFNGSNGWATTGSPRAAPSRPVPFHRLQLGRGLVPQGKRVAGDAVGPVGRASSPHAGARP